MAEVPKLSLSLFFYLSLSLYRSLSFPHLVHYRLLRKDFLLARCSIRCDGYGEFPGRTCPFRVKGWRFKEIVLVRPGRPVDGNTVIFWRLGKYFVSLLGSLFGTTWMVRVCGKRITPIKEIERCMDIFEFRQRISTQIMSSLVSFGWFLNGVSDFKSRAVGN